MSYLKTVNLNSISSQSNIPPEELRTLAALVFWRVFDVYADTAIPIKFWIIKKTIRLSDLEFLFIKLFGDRQ